MPDAISLFVRMLQSCSIIGNFEIDYNMGPTKHGRLGLHIVARVHRSAQRTLREALSGA